MALLQLAVSTRNARLDAIETDIGASPVMKLRTGAAPADCASADTGAVVATLALPADWMAAASGGSKSKSGTWQDVSADSAGTIGHFRVYDSGGTCRMQGDASLTSGSGFMKLDAVDVQAGQQIIINTFTLTDGNA